jgi:hypothetical protein
MSGRLQLKSCRAHQFLRNQPTFMPRQGGIPLIMAPWVGNAHGPDGPALKTQKLRLLVGYRFLYS